MQPLYRGTSLMSPDGTASSRRAGRGRVRMKYARRADLIAFCFAISNYNGAFAPSVDLLLVAISRSTQSRHETGETRPSPPVSSRPLAPSRMAACHFITRRLRRCLEG